MAFIYTVEYVSLLGVHYSLVLVPDGSSEDNYSYTLYDYLKTKISTVQPSFHKLA